jgi:hypothetical protein
LNFGLYCFLVVVIDLSAVNDSRRNLSLLPGLNSGDHYKHRLRESDCIALAEQSRIVPPGRERLVGKALFCGFETDFAGALHLMIPQLEHMIRWQLEAAGVITTTLDEDGLEKERGLSALIDLPEATAIFGEDLIFEFAALLCDDLGVNLRNDMAHGLLTSGTCESRFAIYVWWLGLSLVVRLN